MMPLRSQDICNVMPSVMACHPSGQPHARTVKLATHSRVTRSSHTIDAVAVLRQPVNTLGANVAHQFWCIRSMVLTTAHETQFSRLPGLSRRYPDRQVFRRELRLAAILLASWRHFRLQGVGPRSQRENRARPCCSRLIRDSASTRAVREARCVA
jgi:hypothetical protein